MFGRREAGMALDLDVGPIIASQRRIDRYEKLLLGNLILSCLLTLIIAATSCHASTSEPLPFSQVSLSRHSVIGSASYDNSGKIIIFNSNASVSSMKAGLRQSSPLLNSVQSGAEVGKYTRSLLGNNAKPVPQQQLVEYWKEIRDSTNRTEGLLSAALSMGLLFQKFVQIELAGTKANEHYNSLQFDGKIAKSLEEQAMNVSDLIAMQLKEYVDALENMATSLKLNAEEQSQVKSLEITSCCEMKSDNLVFEKYFKTKVSKYEACKTVPSKRKPSMFVPNHSFNKVLIENSNRLPHLKWQYFVSPEGVHVEYPGNNQNCKVNGNTSQPIFNPKGPSGKKLWLIQKTKDDTRNHRIVFLIQLGKETTPAMIKSIRNIVLLLLRFLDESDEVGIVNSEADLLWPDFLCDQMVPVTSWTRYQIMSYLNYIENKYNGLHASQSEFDEDEDQDGQVTSSGIQKAIFMACANFTSDSPSFPPTASTIIHLRSGMKLEGLGLKSFQVNCPIFLDTFFLAPLNASDEESYKKAIQGVASKNVWRVQVFSSSQAEPESFAVKVALKLNSKKEWWSLSDILSQFFPKPNEKYTKSNDFSFPHWNPVSKEAVIIAKKYVFHGGRPLGLVAVEIPLTFFTQHVTYFVDENTCNGQNYAFLIDKQGRVLTHPALKRPDISREVLSPVQIDQIEVHHGFNSLKRKMLSQERHSGCQSLILRAKKSWVTYAWSAVNEFDYVVVLVFYGDDGGCARYKQDFVLKKSALSPKADVQHHHLLKETQYCYQQPLNLNKAALYLAPNAFNRPADIISPSFSPHFSHSNLKQPLALMAYIGDSSGLLDGQNRGLKPTVKDHIAALSVAVGTWKWQYFNSEWNKFILRRYGTGGGGTFLLMHPGSVVTTGYIPSSSKWFRLASSGANQIRFTSPVIDFNSGVPYSTISQVINANVSGVGAKMSEVNQVAVLAADLNLGFFQKIIDDIMPECRNLHFPINSSHVKASNGNGTITGVGSIRCFLLDESGYVIYHPNLMKSLKTLRDIHITQLEPLYVIDMLQYSQNNHRVPMKKEMCHKLSEASATQGSLQRIYTLSMGKEGFQKSKHGEQCSRYTIVPVSGTNLFLVMVHDSCPSSAAFCPCSTVDKLCLNCLRMEPSDCECPCECPREPSFCNMDDYSDLPEDIEPCEFPAEELPMVQQQNWNCSSNPGTTAIPAGSNRCGTQCAWRQISCSKLTTSEECTGSWDCTWCIEEDSKAEAAITGVCKTVKECYEYTSQKENQKPDIFSETVATEEFSNIALSDMIESENDDEAGTALFPALGVLVVFIVFLALVFFCYRHRALNSSNSQPDLHLLPLQESPRCSIIPQAGSSRSDSDAELFQVPLQLPVAVGGSRGRRRQDRFFAPPRSPMGSVIATDSDHGYSTMTPHEDSECGAPLPFVLIDPPPVLPPTSSLSSAHQQLQQHSGSLGLEAGEPLLGTTSTDINRVIVPVTIHELPT